VGVSPLEMVFGRQHVHAVPVAKLFALTGQSLGSLGVGGACRSVAARTALLL